MMVTNTARRLFLQKTGLAGLTTFLPGLASSSASSRALLASAYHDRENNDYGVAVLNEAGETFLRERLPGRGHACLYNSRNKQLLVFARRPGTYLVVLDLLANNKPQRIANVPGRHFYGHGCFDYSGRRLFASENAYDEARGVIGVYDTDNAYKRLGEFPSYGVGPHDLLLLPDGKTLLVANGGIETHPDTGRDKLNLFEMQSNVVFIDTSSGKRLKTLRLGDEYQQLSLRHLSLGANGDAYVGAQFEGALEDTPELAATISTSGELSLWPMPAIVSRQMRNYISSIEAIPNSNLVALSSSRGGLVILWDTTLQRVHQRIPINDGSGIITTERAFYISDGNGNLHASDSPDSVQAVAKLKQFAALRWDNHIVSFTL